MEDYNGALGNEEFIRQQIEAYQQFEKRRQMAAEDLSPQELHFPLEDEDVFFSPDTNLDHHLALAAQQEQQEEEIKKEAERQKQIITDNKLAKLLEEEEQQKIAQEKERQQSEEILNMIRQEAQAEAQEQLRKVQEEKAQIEAQLRQLSAETPGTWVQSSPCQRFDVAPNTEEWNFIVSRFNQGVPAAHVTKIERNQNKELWEQYCFRKKKVEKNNDGLANETLCWHGSRNGAYDVILTEGFDFRISLMSGAIGAGVYFGAESGISSGYVTGNSKKMLLCRAALGAMGRGERGIRRPPVKPGTTKLYDSVGTSQMYVVFDNYQAYPEYIIYY